MKRLNKRHLKIFASLVILSVLCYWDLSLANSYIFNFKTYKPTKEFDSITSATAKVSIIRSDDPKLSNPTPITDSEINYEQIESMVREAIAQAEGIDWLINSGDMVLLKPNIVEPEPPGSGEVTDVRVVKALIKIIDEIDPGNIEIVVGEGSPRPLESEMDYQSKYASAIWKELWDVAGYDDLLSDPYLSGINLRFSNLNGSPADNPWQDLVQIEIPGGGAATNLEGKYYVHKDVLNADVFITVPVLKMHTTGITNAIKNQVGTAPSTRYGFPKTEGVPQDNKQNKLLHSSRRPVYWIDEEIVDFATIAGIDFAVVDAIACLETKKTAIRDNQGNVTNLVRMNSIIAGSDPVAVDNVCARMVGLNPDDIDHLVLAERVGLGTNNEEQIIITGADLESTKRRFKKDKSNSADFGQSPRDWLLSGPFSINGISDPMEHEFINNEADLAPLEELDNWSESIYFMDDRIDLDNYYNNPENVIVYAFTYFDAPKDQVAESWIGSDEGIKVFLNGQVIHDFTGNRHFDDDEFVSEKNKSVQIKKGENRLLVKVLQKYGNYDFSLNICEPEPNPDFDGNRVYGLKFKTKSTTTGISETNEGSINIIEKYKLEQCYPNPFNISTQIRFNLSKKNFVNLSIYNSIGEKIITILENDLPGGIYELTWNGKDDMGISNHGCILRKASSGI